MNSNVVVATAVSHGLTVHHALKNAFRAVSWSTDIFEASCGCSAVHLPQPEQHNNTLEATLLRSLSIVSVEKGLMECSEKLELKEYMISRNGF